VVIPENERKFIVGATLEKQVDILLCFPLLGLIFFTEIMAVCIHFNLMTSDVLYALEPMESLPFCGKCYKLSHVLAWLK
jgi:hypothetical protein